MKSLAELTPEQILGVAIQIEERNHETFKTFTELFADYEPRVGEIFEELAKEEEEHAAVLRQRFKERFGELSFSVHHDEVREVVEAPELEGGEAFVFDEMTPLKALHIALKAERDAQHFYQQLEHLVDDEALRAIYRELGAFEDEHFRKVQGWIDRLKSQGGQ